MQTPEEILKELNDRFMNDTMFVRTIFCNPDCYDEVLAGVKADDIKVYKSDYVSKGHYIMAKDILRKIENIQLGSDTQDFINNTFTVTAQTCFY